MFKYFREDRPLYGQIAKLTGPIILQNLLSAAVTSADVIMLNFVGQEHISAVSLAAQYATVLFMILYGLGTGITMLSAQYFGKGDMRAVEAVQGLLDPVHQHPLVVRLTDLHLRPDLGGMAANKFT